MQGLPKIHFNDIIKQTFGKKKKKRPALKKRSVCNKN